MGSRTRNNVGDAQRPIFVPLEVMAVPLYLLLYLLADCCLIVTRLYVLPISIDKAGSCGGRNRLNPIPIDVFDASFPELLDEAGGLCLQGSCQAQS